MATSPQLLEVEMPDGTVIEGVPEGTPKQEVLNRWMKSKALQAKKNIASQAPALDRYQQGLNAPPGFSERYLEAFGVTPEAIQQQQEHPIQHGLEQAAKNNPYSMAAGYFSNLYNRAKQGGQEQLEALQNVSQGGPIGANVGKYLAPIVQTGLAAIPGGEAANQVGEDVDRGNLGGAAGTGLATLLQTAALGEITPGAEPISKSIPSRARAGANIQAASKVANPAIADTTKAMGVATEAEKMMQSGGPSSKLFTDFLDRVRSGQPMTFEDLRRFYTNASKQSIMERLQSNKPMKRLTAKMTSELGAEAQRLADQAGVGEQFRAGMKEYARASKLKKALVVGGLLAAGYKTVGPLVKDALIARIAP